MVSLEPLTGPPPSRWSRHQDLRNDTASGGLRVGRADGRVPRDDGSLDRRDDQIDHDAGGRPEEDRGPGDVEAKGARALDDDPAEDERRAAEILRDDRPDEAER